MKKILFLFLFLFAISCYGQNPSKLDTNYIKKYSNHVSIAQGFYRKDLGYSMKERFYPRLVYSIDSRIGLAYEFAWKFISFGFGVNIPIGKNEAKYGKSKNFDLRFDIVATNRMLIDLYLIRTKGMYLRNPKAHIPNFDTRGPYPQFENIKANQLGVDVLYIFNHRRYSYKAAFAHNQRQLKSSNTPTIGGYVFSVNVKNDGLLYPSTVVTDFDKLDSLKGFEILTFGVQGGYAHNITFMRYGLIGFVASVGLGVNRLVQNRIVLADENSVNFSARLKTKLDLGYHGEVHSAGARITIDGLFTSSSSKIRGNTLLGYMGLFYNLRFPTKKARK